MAIHTIPIQNRLQNIYKRIKDAMLSANRTDHNGNVQTNSIKLIAVSKLHPSSAIYEALLAGQVDFGENYVQEALSKQEEFNMIEHKEVLNWHFIGHIQSRKAKDIVGRFTLIHSVDSEKLAKNLQQHAEQKGICQPILVQVNIGGECQKSGVNIKDLKTLVENILTYPNLELQGLMCIPPVFDAGLLARPYFALLRKLRDDLAEEFDIKKQLQHLSMGMSGDLEAAILEGATLIRVGTDIFGKRNS